MDVLDDVLGMMGSSMLQRQPSRGDFLAAALRGQPSFADQPMIPTPPPQAMQPQPQPQQPAYDPQRPLRQAMTARGGYPAPQAAPTQPAPAQAAPQAPQRPQVDPEYQDLIRRQQEADAAEQRALQPVDRSQAEAAYRAHSDSAMSKTMLALAAAQAGPSYQGMQNAWMRQAEDAESPMKMAGGTMTREGWIQDPTYEQNLAVQRAVAKSASIARALEHHLTLAERARLQGEKIAADKEIADARNAMHLQTAQLIHAAGGGGAAGGSEVGTTPEGAPIFRTKDGSLQVYQRGVPTTYKGDIGAKRHGEGTTTEGERKAATLLQRLEFSQQQLQRAVAETPSAAKPTVTTRALQKVPLVGEDAANAVMSPARQRVEAAQLDLLDAALTLGTGAAYTREQLQGYSRSYFAQPGDDARTVADKRARLDNVISAARIAAGRAAPKATSPTAMPPSGGAGPHQVRSAEDYHALPSGATYTDPSGVTRTKP